MPLSFQSITCGNVRVLAGNTGSWCMAVKEPHRAKKPGRVHYDYRGMSRTQAMRLFLQWVNEERAS